MKNYFEKRSLELELISVKKRAADTLPIFIEPLHEVIEKMSAGENKQKRITCVKIRYVQSSIRQVPPLRTVKCQEAQKFARMMN